MECHDVRALLAFTQRPCEAVDGAEREAVAQHLRGCADCAALAQGERAFDHVLGQAMIDVRAPGDLKSKVMKRLAAARGRSRWKGAAAVAAGLLMALAATLGWHDWSRPEVTDDDVNRMVDQERWNDAWNADRAREYLRAHGLSVNLPSEFDYGYLRSVEMVELKGRPVAKLDFARGGEHSASANVLILPDRQFRTNIAATTMPDGAAMAVRHQHDCSYVIFFRGDLNSLLAELN